MIPSAIAWPDPPIIAAIIAVLGVGLTAWLTWLASGASRLQTRIDTLEVRQTEAEKRIAGLETEKRTALDALAAAASFINRIGYRILSGRGPWPEIPSQIAPHIDAELWDDIPVGGSE